MFCFDPEFCFKNEYFRSFLEQKQEKESFRSWKNVNLPLLYPTGKIKGPCHEYISQGADPSSLSLRQALDILRSSPPLTILQVKKGPCHEWVSQGADPSSLSLRQALDILRSSPPLNTLQVR